MTNDSNGLFNIDSDGLISVTSGSLVGSSGKSFTFQVEASDMLGITTTADITVNVQPARDPDIGVSYNGLDVTPSIPVDVNTTDSSFNIEIHNAPDGGVLSIDDIVFGGEITDVTWTDGTISPDSSISATVSFDNPDVGPYAAWIEILSNDPDENPFYFDVDLPFIPDDGRPFGTDDYFWTLDEIDLVVSVSEGVLANDYDFEGDLLSAVLVSSPNYAESFTFNPDGSFQYDPIDGYDGTDSFVYQPFDGIQLGDPVTVGVGVGRVIIESQSGAAEPWSNGDEWVKERLVG